MRFGRSAALLDYKHARLIEAHELKIDHILPFTSGHFECPMLPQTFDRVAVLVVPAELSL